MTSKFSIDNRELLQRISSGEAVVGIDFGNLIIRELAAFRLTAMDSESWCLPIDYLQGHKDGLEWASQLAEANHPETGDWLYDDPIELAKAIRKGPDMPPVQPVADSEPVIVVGDDGGDALSYRRLIQSFEPGTKLYRHAQPAPVVPDGLRLALSNAGIAAPESDEMLAATCEKHIQALVTWVKDRKPFQSAPVVPTFDEWLELSGNKPLGWVKDAMRESYDACRSAMLAAAPQLPGSEPATVPGKWIPVSERMPPPRYEVLVGRWWGEKPRWCCKWATYIPGHPDAQSSGWLIPGASWAPTHWMPLPAAPQEDINALIPLVSRNEQEGK